MPPDASGNTYGIVRADRGYFVVGRSALAGVTPVVGGTVLATQDGSQLTHPPMFLDVPGTGNNVLDVSEYAGLYYPTARLGVDVIDDWFTAANLNAWFMDRGTVHGTPGFDDLSVIGGGGIFCDGNRAFALLGAKGDSLTLSSRQNDIVRCQMSWMGAAQNELSWEDVQPPLGQRASFAHANFTAGVAGVTDWQISIMNNCRPNPIIGESTGTAVVEINAGKPRFELALNVDARGTFPAAGVPIVLVITPPGGVPVTFTATLPRIDNPDEIAKRGERSGQPFNVICKSPDGATDGLVIT